MAEVNGVAKDKDKDVDVVVLNYLKKRGYKQAVASGQRGRRGYSHRLGGVLFVRRSSKAATFPEEMSL